MAGQNLKPVPNRWRRLIVWVLFSGVALYFGRHWGEKIGLTIASPFILGTYRRFRVANDALKHRWTVAFLDLAPKSYKLKRYSRIEVKYSERTSAGEMMIFGLLALPMGWVLDMFFPWLGGTYEIWLTRGIDTQVLAWQGNSQKAYEHNLDILQKATNLETIVR